MAIYGGVREGWGYASGPRFNNTLFRGIATFASAASVLVTLPLPARLVTCVPGVELIDNTAPPNVEFTVKVGTGSTANAFTIYAWQVGSGASAAPPSAQAVTIGTSPYSYTSGTSGPAAPNGEFVVIGGDATATSSFTITRGSVTTAATVVGAATTDAASVVLFHGDVLALTYASGTPTVTSFPFPAPSSAVSTAYSNSLSVYWEAWCDCSGVQGY